MEAVFPFFCRDFALKGKSMENSSNMKSLGNRSFFRKFSTALSVPVFLASANLLSAANAEGGRGEAWQDFQVNNPGLDKQELKQMFKQEWREQKQLDKLDDIRDQIQNNLPQNNIQSVVPQINNIQNLNKNDFATKAEFKAYKDALKENNLTENINKTFQQTETNKIINVNHGFSLDLTSAVESITLGNNLFKEQQSVTINVGGQEKTLNAGSKVTAAEYVAAKQALVAGGQSVHLDAEGRAIGGSVDLSALTTGNNNMKVDDLVVPVDVIASGNFGKGGDVKIQGDLVNSGSINAFADGGKVNAWIFADNITNNSGAEINSTVSDLTLSADNDFNNYGSITATGNLTVAAGGSLTNSGSISAQQHLNVFSPNVINTGSIASTQADVTFDAIASGMNINNTNGTIAALNGAINIREAGYTESFNSLVTGGDLLSEELNVHTGGGMAEVFVNQLTGVVNAEGTGAHVSADTSVLTIGNQCLIGDPTYFNTGDIVLDGDIVVGEALAIIAGGNITATANLSQITARDLAGQGYDIAIIAGANITGSPTGPTPTPLPAQGAIPTGNATSSVTFDGADPDGGSVDFSGANASLVISSQSTTGDLFGGSVSIVAYTNNGTGGQVTLPFDSVINTGGSGTEASGNVFVLGSAGVSLGQIDTLGSGGGTVAIYTAQPIFTEDTSMTFNVNGVVTSGNGLFRGTLGSGEITVNDIQSHGKVFLESRGNIVAESIVTENGSIHVENSDLSTANITINGALTAGGDQIIELLSGSSATLTVNSTLNAHNLTIGTGTLNFTAISVLSANQDSSGEGGSIIITANTVTVPGGLMNLSATGTGSGDGGNINLTLFSPSAVDVSSSGQFTFDAGAAGTGNGGQVTAFFGGDVTLGVGGIVGSSAASGGGASVSSNGDITVNSGGINVAGADGDGARVSLRAGLDGSGVLTINDAAFLTHANASGANGSGGSMRLEANSIVGPGHITLQATGQGTGDGGSATLNLTSISPVTVGTTGQYSFDVRAFGSGDGGVATGTFGGAVDLNDGGVLGGGGGNGGGAVISAGGDLVARFNSIQVQGGDGDGALVSLKAGESGIGSLFFDSTDMLGQANATGANGDGGSIILSGTTSIFFDSALTAPLTLTANGVGTGDGGFISYRTNSTDATFIVDPNAIIKAPKPPVNFLQLSAESGSAGGHGGGIDVAVGGNLTVDPLFMTAGPQAVVGDWDGAFYSLQAGTTALKGGALVITGSINANGVNDGLGGVIALSSRSSTAFVVGGTKAPKNGILGTLSAVGDNGFIAINNGLGSVTIAQNGAMTADSIMLSTGGKGSITTATGVVVTAASDLTLIAGTGSIGGKKPMLINTADLVAQTNGFVGLQNVSTTVPIVVHDSSGGLGFTLRTDSATILFDILVGNKGSITITQGPNSGLLEVADVGLLTAFNGGITLQNLDTVGGSIRIGTEALVQTLGKGKPVVLSFGAVIPKKGTNPYVPPGPAPDGIDAINTGKGIVFFGTPGTVTAEVPSETATVHAKGVNVIFNSVNNRPIILGEGSIVLADPPVRTPDPSSVRSFASFTESAPVDNQTVVKVGEGETSKFTSDLSVLNLTVSPQAQAATNATLMTASNAPAMPSIRVASQSSDEDDSYAVGYCGTTGEIDGAICSDNQFVAGRISDTTSVKSVAHSERVSIKSGNVLFVPSSDTVVDTPYGIVRVGAKSVALVSVTPAGLAVYDLDDKHKGAVVLESNGHNLVLSPGCHAMVTPHHEAQFAQINAIETIAHRNLTSALKNGMRAHTSEFSVISAMDTVRPVKALFKALHPKGKQVADHMLKTSAIVMHLGSGGKYQHYFKPRLTAMK